MCPGQTEATELVIQLPAAAKVIHSIKNDTSGRDLALTDFAPYPRGRK